MKMVNRKQSHQISGAFQTNVDWDAVPFDVGQSIIEDPIGFGREATRFIINGGRVTVVTTNGIIPPPGGMIQILSVPVDESRSWKDAVKAAGSNTIRDGDIWKVGDQYSSAAVARPTLKQIILSNFGKAVRSEEALAWGNEQKLKSTTPRACFAVSERYPALHHYFGTNPIMVVVTLMSCSFECGRLVPGVWLDDARRGAHLYGFDIGWPDHVWFAFDCE